MARISRVVFSFSFNVSIMGTKKKLKFVFANNLPKAKDEPVKEEPVQNEVPEEEPANYNNAVEETASEEATESSDDTKIHYPPLEYPKGTPENGILLCIILSLIILFSLGFLIWHEHTWRQQEEQNNDVQVDDTYQTLTSIVRNYVATIEESNKSELCSQLKQVYLDASVSDQDVDSDLAVIKTESRRILGFDERKARTNEHEWQKLLGSTGVIDSWLTHSGIKLSNETKRDVFKAIAEGLN